MKNTKPISESDIMSSLMDTSSTTASGSAAKGAKINVKKKDLADPSLQKSLGKMKDTQVSIVDESPINEVPVRLKYLSNIKDAVTGKVAEPFTINDKRYQMVRAMSETKEKVTGVYCLDEVDETGEALVHPVDYFEKHIASSQKPAIQETQTESPAKVETLKSLNLSVYKFFFVNKTTGKARKFKTAEELAEATKTQDEEFMSLAQFKKYVEGTVFGSKKKKDDLNELTEDQSPEELHAKAQKLMHLIATKIPEKAITTLKASKIAQKEVILAFAELIGVPRTLIGQIIGDVKDLSKQGVTSQDGQTTSMQSTTSQTSMDGQAAPTFNESKVITKSQLIENAKK